MLSSTLYIMSHMHLQSLKLLCPTVKEGGDAFTRNYLTFDLDLGVKVT